MNIGEILAHFNIFAQCRKYNLSLWQCPSFLSLVMGVVIILSALIAYALGARYIENPEVVALIVLLLTMLLFIVDFSITRGFEKLAEANRLKSEFINVVSHQLRAPLSNLKWTIDLLISGRIGKIEEKQTEYFKILKENSGRMGDLVSDLLTASRIETATLSFRNEDFSLAEMIKELISEFEPFTRASNVELKFRQEPNLPEIFGDPNQIRQAIENLIDNAIRYVKDKGQVEIRLGQKNKSLYLEIKDNGVGIPKDDQKYIFQKFFRSQNALRHQTQGSGLGLYIAKSIIERSGGKIGFSSQEGDGSTFWFMLPLKKPPAGVSRGV